MILIPRQGPARRRRAAKWLVAGALSALAHVVFVGLLVFLSYFRLNLPAAPRTTARPVVLRPIAAESWAQNRGEQRPQAPDAQRQAARPRPAEEKKPEQKKPEVKPDGQVVAVAPGNGQTDPNAKYLAESANKAEKQTRAKETTPFYRNAMPQRTVAKKQEGEGQDNVDEVSLGGNRGQAQDDRPLRDPSEQKAVLEVPTQEERTELAMRTPTFDGPGPQLENREEREALQGNSDRLKLQPGSAEGAFEASRGRLGEPGAPNLLPSRGVLDQILGAAANDHLKDVEEGEGTFLSTKEWKYASFFNRVKQSVGTHWNPGQELRLRDPTGVIYGGRDRYTVLSVTLNERGQVRDVYVEKSSGLDFLDLEAIRSFERAQPFPNPPPGLIGTDSMVRFSFGFFLELGGGPRMRLFRQAN